MDAVTNDDAGPSGSTSTETPASDVYRFMSLTGTDRDRALFCLDAAGNDYSRAVELYQREISNGFCDAPPKEFIQKQGQQLVKWNWEKQRLELNLPDAEVEKMAEKVAEGVLYWVLNIAGAILWGVTTYAFSGRPGRRG
ncbi:hypothetical protein BSKO_04007 [Bryopsis sp. KO-2023]|nr:hypothetical protein BSKO_04007 [Bryopsis sp. KO-2023]